MQRLLRLLSDPTRVRILAALEPEELAVGEIAHVLGMSQSRISNHLRLLRDAEALSGRRDGGWTFYRNALEDHPEGALLWPVVREATAGEADQQADAERRRRVLDERRRRSMDHFARGEAAEEETLLERGTLHHELLAALLPRHSLAVDAGCGEGVLTEVLAPHFGRVVAVDHSPERLARARLRVTAPHVEFREGEVEGLPVADGEADALFLSLVLHHVPELTGALKEAFRVLRPGGLVVVAELAAHDLELMRERRGDLRLGLDPALLARLLRQAGFRETSFHPLRDRLVAEPGRTLELFLASGRRPEASKTRKPRRRNSAPEPRRKT